MSVTMVLRRILAVVVWIACAGYGIDWIIELYTRATTEGSFLGNVLIAIKSGMMLVTFLFGAWLWGVWRER